MQRQSAPFCPQASAHRSSLSSLDGLPAWRFSGPRRTGELVRTAVATLALLTSTKAQAEGDVPSGKARSNAATIAADTPRTSYSSYSPYEQASLEEAAKSLDTRLDTRAEGKEVEGIDVVTLEVVEKRDPAPRFLNVFHARTRDYVVEREVLLSPGDRFQAVLCDETARNLRSLPQLSLVICAATAGSTDDKVRVLVITKDVWSLRSGWDVSFIGGGLNFLQITPTETNLAGTHQIVFANYLYQPESQSLSLGYRIPRVGGRRLGLVAEAGLIWDRHGQIEGSAGSLGVGRPQYSTRTEWAWSIGTNWRDEIVRRYQNGRLYVKNDVPWAYRARRIAEGAYATRSFGWANKHDITFGAEFNARTFRRPDAPLADPRAVEAFAQDHLPTSDTRVGPFVQYHAYTSNYLRVLDFESLGLQEDFRLGHDFYLKVYPITRSLGSTRTFVGTYAAFQYTIPLGDGLVRASVESLAEAEEQRIADGAVGADLRIVSPRLGFGRVVFDASVLNRYRNYLNRHSFLGGDGRLRGYPSSYFDGKDVIVYNLEFRSRPVELFSCQLGGAAFYDVGGTADGLENIHPRHAVGFGFRVLFPQLDRVVFRGDVGFPLVSSIDRRDRNISVTTFSVAFEQAFAMPGVGSRVGTSPGVGYLGQ
ncbi:MAG TPA: hypothetical protein VJT73_04470 [Polyangiaceae bacterium]|nr:hypothetical protein [Polyangiaceae bacterium]